ncbi:SDR family oxidoreductase [Aurantiacibacter xanthus]|uniref:SDR family oxidoreductase n=1 Tax=Aurantiacibacter xanthus TaxID=1784712 RepID=A0A3A1P2W4_9SPHN|nr:SDR family oxidoreductase [Aurantiacibacter xanthus]RIV82618.1 SDR family oxidoreductase [Aurantiacibacter xanthus]
MAKTVLVTGASSGFGKAIAQRFLAAGWNVVASMRRPDPALFEAHARLRLVQLDVTDQASIDTAVVQAQQAFGGIDVLVNNAGIGAMSAIEFTPDALIHDIFSANLFGTMAMCRAVIPVMRESGGGAILNMTSSMAIAPMPFMSVYGASKWAIEGFSEALAYEVRPFGITVRLLEPGLAPDTRFGESAQDRAGGLTPAPYDKGVAAFQASMRANYPSDLTTIEETAEATLAAACDTSDRLRYPIGGDTQAILAKRRSLPEDAFFAWMRSSFAGEAAQ